MRCNIDIDNSCLWLYAGADSKGLPGLEFRLTTVAFLAIRVYLYYLYMRCNIDTDNSCLWLYAGADSKGAAGARVPPHHRVLKVAADF
jgi:hypothetical protein